MKRKQIFTVLKCLISISFLYLILVNVNWEQVRITLFNARIVFLILALIVNGLGFLISSYKWMLLLRVQGINKTLNELHVIYYIGFFFNNFLPTTIGGDAFRIYKVSKEVKNSMGAVASVIVERITGLIAMITLAIIATIINAFWGDNIGLEWLGLTFLLILLVIPLIVFIGRIIHFYFIQQW